MAARLRPAKTPAIAVRSASFRCAALVFHSADFVPDRYATRNRPDSLMGTIARMADTPLAGCAHGWTRLPFHPSCRPAIRSAPPAESQRSNRRK